MVNKKKPAKGIGVCPHCGKHGEIISGDSKNYGKSVMMSFKCPNGHEFSQLVGNSN